MQATQERESRRPPASLPTTQEADTLSQRSSSLSNLLARRRADLALMRAEAATLAISLEAAKQSLDLALRDEAVIRAAAPSSPRISQRAAAATSPHFAAVQPDAAFVRALAAQVHVTNTSVRHAVARRTALLRELDDGLKPSPAFDTCVHDGCGTRDAGATNSQHEHVLSALTQGVSSRSSFRFDHARIWRDVTMPNLVLAAPRPPSHMHAHCGDQGLTLGVVTERIFEGITCFTPTGKSGASLSPSSPPPPPQCEGSGTGTGTSTGNGNGIGTDLRIESYCVRAQGLEDWLKRGVTKQFSVVVARGFGQLGRSVRVVGPSVALHRAYQLVCDASGRTTMATTTATPSMTPVTTTAATETETETETETKTSDDVLMTGVMMMSLRRSDKSSVLRDEDFARIMQDGVPIRFHESRLGVIYSTDVDGMSLRTLYTRVKAMSPTVIAIRDTRGGVFGCYAAHSWKSSSTRYYGSGESFVFGMHGGGGGMVRVFKWSRRNSLFQFTANNFLAIGGGADSHFALWIDEDLLMGTTSTCATFDSPPLTPGDRGGGDGDGDGDGGGNDGSSSSSSCTEFKILALEVWGFDVGRQ